ncbi:hypothetical protein GPJ56_005940 [Histomonas meleagridis]|uniref:uncharacterized protein n=1 Tax=Histomonas meleagridis TaxID=135588 RepID=UPI00355A0F51|nr:hypothetical protein GPJ56_005940 [Histomonas meleagridis]KAH0803155.1 hypothetical protein GO595_004046 [Histomonas meleagridis]
MFNLACNIAANSITIHPNSYNPSYQHNFIYMKTDNVTYPLLTDPEFGITVEAAKLYRTVEYCQWVEEGFDSTDKTTRTRRYYKSWVHAPINSSNFMDQRYYNPLSKSYNNAEFQQDINIGLYTVKSELLNEAGQTNELNPTIQHIHQFMNSNAHNKFHYIGNGYFYSSTEENQNKEVNMPKNNKELHQFFQQCTPGDIRSRITYYAPNKLTIVGYLEEHNIIIKNIRGVQMGGARSGYMSGDLLLSERYAHKRKFALIARLVAVISSIFLILNRSTSLKAEIWNFSMFGLLVLFIRSLMWNTVYLNPYIWFSILSIMSCIYSTRPEQFVTFD